MKKVFLILLLCSFSYAIKWDFQRAYTLKKDEVAQIILHQNGKQGENNFIFKFRWTLNDGQKVVVISHFRDYPNQYIFYWKNRLKTFRQDIYGNKTMPHMAYVLLELDSFDEQTKEITFLLFVKDGAKKFKIETEE